MDCPCNLGLFSHCQDIHLGFTALVAGNYRFRFFTNGSYFDIPYLMSINDEFVIEGLRLNENAIHKFVIIQPDGNLFSYNNCTSFTFEVRTIPEAPLPPLSPI